MRRLLRSRIRGIEFTNYVYLTHCDPCWRTDRFFEPPGAAGLPRKLLLCLIGYLLAFAYAFFVLLLRSAPRLL